MSRKKNVTFYGVNMYHIIYTPLQLITANKEFIFSSYLRFDTNCFFFLHFMIKIFEQLFFSVFFFCFVYNLIICYILNTWGQIMMMSYAIHIYQCVQPYTNTFAIFWKCRILIFFIFFLYTLNWTQSKDI